MRIYGLLLLGSLITGCVAAPSAPEEAGVPAWAQEAIWYQIFPERFRNGDPSNDPTVEEVNAAWPYLEPSGWEPTPWGWDWYRQEPWTKATGKEFYVTVQARRYGGDLQGMLEALSYLQELGVTALYINPLNDAPSLHKYDARHYRHIDRHFGPDPEGDARLMQMEIPDQPATWQWTAADRLFLRFVAEAHRRGIRVIMDYSWNHTGTSFWAFQDVRKHQAASPYADWYRIERFDDPRTPENEFSYKGWADIPELPEWNRTITRKGPFHGYPLEGDLHPAVKQHIFAVTRRWLDPDGDGDPSDGVDGFRLDVAEQIPMGFWRDYRRFVRSIRPDAFLVGEVWWEVWPDRMLDPRPWLQGDVFDAVMHYRWYMPTRSYFAHALPAVPTASDYRHHIDSILTGMDPAHRRALLNLTASHDTPRFNTSIYNPGPYKYRVTPRENPAYRIDRPDERVKRIQRLILVQQFTFTGAPHIYYGDEVYMWGPDDPDNRKPMVWEDRVYEPEATHPLGLPRNIDPVYPDTSWRAFYRQLIMMRRQYIKLFAYGSLRWVELPYPDVIAYRRTYEHQEALVLLNRGTEPVHLSAIPLPKGVYEEVLTGHVADVGARGLTTRLEAQEAQVWIVKTPYQFNTP